MVSLQVNARYRLVACGALLLVICARESKAFTCPLAMKAQHRSTRMMASDRGGGSGSRGGSKGVSGSRGGGERGGSSSSSSSSRLTRLKRKSSSISFNKAPLPPGADRPSDAPAARISAGAKPQPPIRPPPPPSSQRRYQPPPRVTASGAQESYKSQELMPDHMAPKQSYDIDARPNTKTARKAAAKLQQGMWGAGQTGGYSAAAPNPKLKRSKVQRFVTEDLAPVMSVSDILQCPHFEKCSGCTFNTRLTETPIMDEARAFFRSGNAQLPNSAPFKITVGPHHHWRTQAKLAVAPLSKWGGCVVGLYEEGTHQVAPIPGCVVHHPSINRAVAALEKATEELRIRAYNSDTGEGMLRYIQCVVERRSGKVQLTLVWNTSGKKEAGGDLSRLVKRLKALDAPSETQSVVDSSDELWHSIWVNFRTGPGNAIFSRDPRSWQRLHGAEFLTEKVGPSQVVLYFRPMLFRQGNLDGFERIVERIQDFVPDGSTVCELYGGVGVIGLNLLGKVRELRLSDINPFLDESIDKSLRTLSEKRREKVSFLPMAAADALEAGHANGADVMVVDPPRKGLEAEVLQHLTSGRKDEQAGSVKRLIYVSCGFDALKRDASSLLSSGWRMVHAEGFVLFPGSDHLETLAIFDR